MSYARFGADDSDVYVYGAVGGGLVCCGCAFHDDGFITDHHDIMILHLEAHQRAGHTVPGYVFKRLRNEAAGLTRADYSPCPHDQGQIGNFITRDMAKPSRLSRLARFVAWCRTRKVWG